MSATEYSKGATKGQWTDVWDTFDRRKQARAGISVANEDTSEGGLLESAGVAAK